MTYENLSQKLLAQVKNPPKNGTVQIGRIPWDIYLSGVANSELPKLPPSKDTPGSDLMYLITGVVEI